MNSIVIDKKLRSTAVVFFLLYLVCFFPGFMSYDSADQYLQAINGVYSDGHPPLIAFMWHWVNRIIHGPFGMLIIENAFFCAGVYFIAKNIALNNIKGAVFFRIFFCFLVLFAPPIFSINGVVWKDVLMASFLLFGFSIIFSMYQDKTENSLLGKAILSVLILIVATSSRHNAIAAIPALSWFLIFTFYKNSNKPLLVKLSKAMVFSVPLAGFIFGIFLLINHVLSTQRVYASQTIELYDISGIMKYTHGNLIIDKKNTDMLSLFIDKQNFNFAKIDKLYSPTGWLYLPQNNLVRFTHTRKQLTELRHVWLYLISHNLSSYLTHRYNVYKHMVGLGNTSAGLPVYMTAASASTFNDPAFPAVYAPTKITYTPSTLQQYVESFYVRLVTQKPTLYMFKPWIYLLVGMCVLSYILLARKKEFIPSAFLILSGLMSNFALFFITPSNDYRYSNWTIITVWIALLLILFHKISKLNFLQRKV